MLIKSRLLEVNLLTQDHKGWKWQSQVCTQYRVTQQLYSSHYTVNKHMLWGFPDSSAGKESDCNARDPGLIPGLGRCPGEGIGYPLQFSWASLMAQMVKNLPVMRETWVQSLGWEDPLEKDKATQSSILA